MLPHRLVDDSDNDRTLLLIALRSPSLRIEPIVTLLPISVMSQRVAGIDSRRFERREKARQHRNRDQHQRDGDVD